MLVFPTLSKNLVRTHSANLIHPHYTDPLIFISTHETTELTPRQVFQSAIGDTVALPSL